MKAATKISSNNFLSNLISIHAAREGGDAGRREALRKRCFISIHAAREGGDMPHNQSLLLIHISIHAAREGGDAFPIPNIPPLKRFQSTPPVKAATEGFITTEILCRISIHAAREGGDSYLRKAGRGCAISIHAAREGGDLSLVDIQTVPRYFNPRRP